MKWNRNPHDNSIDSYLTKIYVNKGKFEKVIKEYQEDREVQSSTEYRMIPSEDKIATDTGFAAGAWHLFTNFIIGAKEVDYYLAECFLDGFGVTKDTTLAHLTLSIGAKLGDKKSQEYLNKNNISIPQHIDKLADKCVTEIKKYEADVKGRDVTWEEMVAIAKNFDYFVKKEHNISYYNSIKEDCAGMREYCVCIEPIMEDNAKIQVDMTGQEGSSCCCVII
ncbi:MAG TPA: hypothetical protein LFW10_02760 [Rickettsia endosymbiont of Diachasma alloeum]|nr:hypothetical protein [Rickettsia endosymbiont of Diachasma alloeum]